METEMFNKKVKEMLQNYKAEPPGGSFNKIKEQLGNQDEERKTVFWLPNYIKYAAAAALAFLLGMVFMYSWNQNNIKHLAQQNSELLNQQKQWASQTENDNNNIETALPNSTIQTEKTNGEQVVNNAVSANNTPVNTNEIAQTNSSKKEGNPKAVLTEVNKNTTNATYASVAQNGYQSVMPAASINVNTQNQSHIKIKGGKLIQTKNAPATNSNYQYAVNENYNDGGVLKPLEIQTYALYNFNNKINNGLEVVKVEEENFNTRFLTPQTPFGYKGFWFGPELNVTAFQMLKKSIWGPGFGVKMGYDFAPRFGVQTGLFYQANMRQFETVDIDGNQQKEMLYLNNLEIPLALRYKKAFFARNIERPISINTYTGANYNYFGNINKSGIGGQIGVETDIFLKSEMIITLGMKGGVGSILNYTPAQNYTNQYNPLHFQFGFYSALRFVKVSGK